MNLRAGRRKFLHAALACALPLRAAEPVTIEIEVRKRKPEGGVRTVRITRDDTFVLRVRADEKLEVHLHGYELLLRVEPGNISSVRAAAKLVGRFPVTAHWPKGEGASHAEPALLYLEVHPR
jgi:hypothetical protein